MSKKRNFPHPGPEASERDLIWWRAYSEMMKAIEPFNLTDQDAARVFGLTPTQITDVVGRDDKRRNPTCETLRKFALRKLPDGMHRPNIYYIVTGYERSPEHERTLAQLETCRNRVAELEARVKEQADAIIRLTKNL